MSAASGTPFRTGGCCWTTSTFRVGDGVRAALVGENGAGKTTLLRIIAGDLIPEAGSVARTGGLGVMRQFIGSVRDDTTVQRLLVDLSPPAVREAWDALEAAELALMETDDERGQMAYAHALSHWGDVGGYDAEVTWDTVTVAALGVPYDRCKYRELSTLSGGEQKRLALEALLRGPDEVLLLDEPDNYLDVPGKRWLEERLLETRKTVLFVSHDRELLARVADRVVTVEGGTAWVHGGGFVSYHEARTARHERLAELRRRWDEEHQRLIDLVRTLQQQAANSPDMANRYHAMQTRLAKFEAAGPPPERPPEQKVAMRLRGGRTGVRAVMAEQLELSGLMKPFDTEIWYGDRVGVLGANGAGKSHFLRLLAGQEVAHTGEWRLGARVVPGFFAQTHAHPEWQDRTPVDLLWHGEPGRPGVDRGRAMAALRRYGLAERRRPDVPHAVGRSAGAVPDPAAGAVRRDPAAARRADGQPRRPLRRGARGGAGGVRRDGHGGHPRPLVRPLLRPLPGVRRRRSRLRVGRAGVRRDAGVPRPLTASPELIIGCLHARPACPPVSRARIR